MVQLLKNPIEEKFNWIQLVTFQLIYASLIKQEHYHGFVWKLFLKIVNNVSYYLTISPSPFVRDVRKELKFRPWENHMLTPFKMKPKGILWSQPHFLNFKQDTFGQFSYRTPNDYDSLLFDKKNYKEL